MAMRADQIRGVVGIAKRCRDWADLWRVPAVGLYCALAGNAWQESAFDADAVGDSGWSIGVFQANRKAGLGRGHSIESLSVPEYNTDVLMKEASRLGMASYIRSGATVEQVAAWFCRNVEKPANVEVKAAERASFAAQFAAQFGHTGRTRVMDAA